MDSPPIPQSQPMQAPPRTNSFFSLRLIMGSMAILLVGLVSGFYLGKISTDKPPIINKLSPINPPPTTSPTALPTTSLPTVFKVQTVSSSPTASRVSESITLNVSAYGGGAMGQLNVFNMSFNREMNDTVTILKRNESELKNFPKYVPGALDMGIQIKHGTNELTISPSFEGGGTSIPNKLNTVVINNTKLVDGKIVRLKEQEVMGPQNSQGGSFYTTQYSENPEDCRAFNPDSGSIAPSCILSGPQVFTRSGSTLSIHCTSENENALWCDEIVKSLNVTVKE
jgi:hypothetical protein